MASLEAVASGPSGVDGWYDAVLGAVDELGAALEDHIVEAEGSEGLLEEVLETAPRLAGEVAIIEAEHGELRDAIDRARQTIRSSLTVASPQPERVRRRVMALLGRLALHRQRGADLVYEAYTVDINAGD